MAKSGTLARVWRTFVLKTSVFVERIARRFLKRTKVISDGRSAVLQYIFGDSLETIVKLSFNAISMNLGAPFPRRNALKLQRGALFDHSRKTIAKHDEKCQVWFLGGLF